jgi:hypothetical protein
MHEAARKGLMTGVVSGAAGGRSPGEESATPRAAAGPRLRTRRAIVVAKEVQGPDHGLKHPRESRDDVGS